MRKIILTNWYPFELTKIIKFNNLTTYFIKKIKIKKSIFISLKRISIYLKFFDDVLYNVIKINFLKKWIKS